MDAKLRTCLDFTISKEGGITTDSGGLTKRGISQKAYPHLDIANLTDTEIEKIYETDYYNKVGATQLHPALAVLVFDTAVNCGVARTVKWLQIIINMMTGAGLATDGIMGIKTLQAIEKADPKSMALLVFHQRLFHYYSLRKSQPEAFGGWVGRVADLLRVVGCWGHC